MSWQLRLLNALCRRVVKPRLARAGSPEDADRAFERFARLLFRAPPLLCHLTERAVPPLDWVSVGRCDPRAVLLYIHGGAFVCGSGASYAALAGRLSALTGLRVCLPGYRRLQEAPFPAAVEDVRAAWDMLVARGYEPGRIVIAGDSAGGNLALGLLASLLDEGQRPAAFVGFSPWTDLTLTGDSLVRNRDRDPLLPRERMDEVTDRYLAGADPADPRASPLFATYPEPPPALIQVGSTEILLDDAARIADRLGARFSVWDDCPHIWQLFDGRLPEARAALREAAEFIQAALGTDSR